MFVFTEKLGKRRRIRETRKGKKKKNLQMSEKGFQILSAMLVSSKMCSFLAKDKFYSFQSSNGPSDLPIGCLNDL